MFAAPDFTVQFEPVFPEVIVCVVCLLGGAGALASVLYLIDTWGRSAQGRLLHILLCVGFGALLVIGVTGGISNAAAYRQDQADHDATISKWLYEEKGVEVAPSLVRDGFDDYFDDGAVTGVFEGELRTFRFIESADGKIIVIDGDTGAVIGDKRHAG